MATTTKCSGVRTLDPVQGLADYVNDIKPYHTKIIEVLVEYVYEEKVNVTVLDDSQWVIDIARPSESPVATLCDDGYSTHPFGDSNMWFIASPTPSYSLSYPPIDSSTHSFVVPGDFIGDLIPGTQVEIIATIENYDNTYSIVDIVNIGSPATPYTKAFVIADAPTGTPATRFEDHFSVRIGSPFTPGDVIEAFGTVSDDGRPFEITNIITDGAGTNLTIVEVAQAVLSSIPGGQLGLVRTAGSASGTYTISSAVYSEGSIDSWTGYPDPGTYVYGDGPHTTVTVVEPIVSPTSDPAFSLSRDEMYVAFVRLKPLAIENVLSYSNLPTPDEGYLRRDIIGATVSTLDGFGAAVPDSGKFVVSGNLEKSNIFVGDKLHVLSSTNNNGTYTISSLSYSGSPGTTEIGVVERVYSATAGGILQIDVPANVFVVDGNFISRFVQGKKFEVYGGSLSGTYTTLTSDFVNGKTRIRTTQEVLDVGAGHEIVGVSTGFIVEGDLTSTFAPGTQFNVVGNPSNDGVYTVNSATHITSSGSPAQAVSQTLIIPNEAFQNDVGGEIFSVAPGFIKNHIFGFGESTDLCEFNTEGLVRVKFDEQLKFDGLGLDLRDDLVVYNLENSDTWGYELPIDTILSTTQPTIVESEPLSPSVDDLWFNTTTGILNIWTGSRWKQITTAWWLDTNTMLLYYRTRNQFVDTGWVLFLAEPPGFSSVQPADATSNTNAFVEAYDLEPHQVFHRGVDVYPGSPQQNAYVLYGGNYVQRFIAENRFEPHKFSIPGGILNTGSPARATPYQVATSFPIVSVDDGANSVTIEGDWAWLFSTGRIFSVRYSDNNVADFEISSAVAFGSPTYTEITVTQPIVGSAHSPGTILGAVFDPVVDNTNSNDQPKTYVVPSTPIEPDVDGIIYTWVGPLRIELAIAYQAAVGTAIADGLGISNQLLAMPDRYQIISTDAATNTVRVHYDDPTLGTPVDLSGRFPAGTLITIAGSYGEGNPSSQETNDAMYRVKSAVWDDPTGSPAGTGDTIVEVDINFANIPPYNTLTVNSINNNLGSPSGAAQIVFAGDVTAILQPSGATRVFYIEQPLVSTLPLLNVLTITGVTYSGGVTTATVDQDFINETYTGPLGIIESKYRAGIFYDSTTVSGSPVLWENGYILREAFIIEQTSEGTTAAAFSEDISFGWGSNYQWQIISINTATNEIVVNGDVTSILQALAPVGSPGDPNDIVSIVGSEGSPNNNGTYEVVSHYFTPPSGSPSTYGTTTIKLTPALLVMTTTGNGFLKIENIDVTNWFQYLIREARPEQGSPPTPATFDVYGNATGDVQSGQQFRVMGTSNDGVYTVTSSPVYDTLTGTTNITVASILHNERGGWIESYRDQGIRLVFEDSIGVGVTENATGAVLETSGNIMDAWDYQFWDVGTFDENLGTIIYLYSSVI